MSTISSIAPTQVPGEPLVLPPFEPDGHYEVVNGKFVEKPAMGVYEVWIASELFGWLQRSVANKDPGACCQ